MSRRQIFFTFNGRYLGNAFSNVEIQRDNMYPSVCLQSLNEEVSSNFGTDQFLFDLEGFKNDLSQAEFMDISRQQLKRPALFELVKSYLIHYAYVESLQALEEESTSEGTSLQVADSVNVDGQQVADEQKDKILE